MLTCIGACRRECAWEAQLGHGGQACPRIFLCCNNPVSTNLQSNTCPGGKWHVTQTADLVALLVSGRDRKESKCSSGEDQFNGWQIHTRENEVAVKNEKAFSVLP